METSSLLLLLNADILQSQRAGNEADLAALLHQPSYPPVVIVFLEQKTVTGSVSESPLSCYPQPRAPHRSTTTLTLRSECRTSHVNVSEVQRCWAVSGGYLRSPLQPDSGIICGRTARSPHCPAHPAVPALMSPTKVLSLMVI